MYTFCVIKSLEHIRAKSISWDSPFNQTLYWTCNERSKKIFTLSSQLFPASIAYCIIKSVMKRTCNEPTFRLKESPTRKSLAVTTVKVKHKLGLLIYIQFNHNFLASVTMVDSDFFVYFLSGFCVLATLLVMSSIYDFYWMSGFEPRVLP
jgi:hypothetical protein